MGNIRFLSLCFSHLYVFCINQRLRDKQPQALLEPQWIQAPLLLRVCAQLPLQFLSLLCHSEHSSTQSSLTLGLGLSPSGRKWFLYCMWLQNLCWFPCRWPSWLSGTAPDLLEVTGHSRKEWGTRWLNKYSSQSRQPLPKGSLGRPSGSLSLHGFVLGENKRVLCDLGHKTLG